MNSQQSRPDSSGPAPPPSQNMRAKAGEAASKVADAARQGSGQARQAVSSLASDATKQAKGFLNMQVGAGADLVDHIVESARAAADSLDKNAPQLAGLVRNAADRGEQFSDDLREQTVDDLIKKASGFTRKQPALVFGLASLAGFLAFRVLKSSMPEPSWERESSWEHEHMSERFEGRAG
jgi:ABC-type transporter Mla subunit MlaD